MQSYSIILSNKPVMTIVNAILWAEDEQLNFELENNFPSPEFVFKFRCKKTATFFALKWH
jgi:hypothetical protein